MGALEWGATIFSLIYILFAMNNKTICFLFGIIGSGLWMISSYQAGLKFDAALQVFYVLISILGIYRWKYGGSKKEELPITEYSLKQHFFITVIGLICSAFLIYISQFIEFINLPILDATTTVFLVIGTLLLIERKLSSWIYLVVADIVYVYIYGVSGLWLFVGIMILYIIFGINGYLNWRTIYSGNSELLTASNSLDSEI
ncbi:MAG: nicotinamide riboside transporter PnuC [Bacteroidota bacterium]